MVMLGCLKVTFTVNVAWSLVPGRSGLVVGDPRVRFVPKKHVNVGPAPVQLSDQLVQSTPSGSASVARTSVMGPLEWFDTVIV